MTEPDETQLSSLLTSFSLGPAWARHAEKSAPATRKEFKEPRHGGRDDRGRGEREDRRHGPGKRGPGFQRDRELPPREVIVLPAVGVRVSILPDQEAVKLIAKEVHQVARVYSLYDIAKTLLAERSRCKVRFESEASRPPMFRGKLSHVLFLEREEARKHLWNSELRAHFLDEETVEVDPPSGNFQLVAKCGLSGEWLGPPNFHTYQANLHRLHRERFSHLPFAAYSAKVKTERGEEAVNAWLETMKQRTRWRMKGAAEDAPWIEDQAEAERELVQKAFDEAFEETRDTTLPGSINQADLSPSLFVSLREAGGHARMHPAMLIPLVCKAVESEHLPVFKRQGKLFTGPARPKPLPLDAILAERPGVMVKWIRENKPAKLEGLWQAVLPEGGTAPPSEFAADLFWLLIQGHVLLFTDDTLVVQEVREPQASDAAPAEGGKKKKKRKPKTPGQEAEMAADHAQADVVSETPRESEEPTETPAEVNVEETPDAPVSTEAEATVSDTIEAEPVADPEPVAEVPVEVVAEAVVTDEATVDVTEVSEEQPEVVEKPVDPAAGA